MLQPQQLAFAQDRPVLEEEDTPPPPPPPQIATAEKGYDWSAKPKLQDLEKVYSKEQAVVVKDHRVIRYFFNATDNFMKSELVHKIIRVNTDLALEQYNKVFVPTGRGAEFEELKARSISPEGKVTELNEENIRSSKNVEDYGSFMQFAIEGAEKGGDVEYLYEVITPVRDPFGRQYFQGGSQILDQSFALHVPKYMDFKTKSYNGFPSLEMEEVGEEKVYKASKAQIAALVEEPYAYLRANNMRVDYRLSKTAVSTDDEDLYDNETAAGTFAELVYAASDQERDAIQILLKKMKLKKVKTDKEKINIIESYVKQNINLEPEGGQEAYTISGILSNRYATGLGLTRLFGVLLNEAGIDNELVVTSMRENTRFDPDFCSWSNFTDLFFYLPSVKQYLMPAVPSAMQPFFYNTYRVGPAPYQMAAQEGLFITASERGVEKHKVKPIPMSGHEENSSRISAEVSFNKDFEPQVKIEHGWTGFRAAEYRTIYALQKDEFVDGRVQSGMEDSEILNKEVFNAETSDNGDFSKEFYVASELKVESLVSKAGDSYLFHIGNMIGGQVELYQENERQAPIDMGHPIFYDRSITFTVPDGYKVANLEDVKIQKQLKNKAGEVSCQFWSDYSVRGNTVVVNADEFYRDIQFDKSQYEPFREVINAAADFNKVVLVLEKE